MFFPDLFVRVEVKDILLLHSTALKDLRSRLSPVKASPVSAVTAAL